MGCLEFTQLQTDFSHNMPTPNINMRASRPFCTVRFFPGNEAGHGCSISHSQIHFPLSLSLSLSLSLFASNYFLLPSHYISALFCMVDSTCSIIRGSAQLLEGDSGRSRGLIHAEVQVLRQKINGKYIFKRLRGSLQNIKLSFVT